MKKAFVSILVLCVVALTSCMKGVDEVEKQNENEKQIREYLVANNLNPTRDTIGIYGILSNFNPSARKLEFGDSIKINLNVFLLNGTKVTGSEVGKPIEMIHGFAPLYGLHLALTWLRIGEKATMLLPYYAAYGTGGSTDGKVPAYTPVRLEVELVGAKSEAEQMAAYIAKNNYEVDLVTPDKLNMTWLKKIEEGDTLGMGKRVTVAYRGFLLNGTKFDEGALDHLTGSTQLIKGFDYGIRKMKVGEKAMVIFPSSLGYGSRTDLPKIPPFAPLAFEIEVTKLN
jgi:FKBP-type peptidyl-prolyl cis-trans isomerase